MVDVPPGPRFLRLTVAALATVALSLPLAGQTRDTLPASLTDREFWELSEKMSEPDGFFRSGSGSPDNLLSNENTVSTAAAQLAARMKPGGVYLGVGPEQNFTYIAAMRPRIAFVTDIRRGNLHLHLMYKALFELSANRVEFITRLFSLRQPPEGTATSAAADLLFGALRVEPGDEATFKTNLKAIVDHLTRKRQLPLGADDITGIEYVYRNFHRFGPGINYTSSINGRTGSSGSYASILSATDRASGEERTYLANEANFTLIKTMESRNLIVPIVGDFAGPKALRAVGAFLKERGVVVSAFYVSNVEQYLQRNGVWQNFCANVATMPLDDSSVFIRGISLSPMAAETARCAGR
jgi:hypothetical protein